MDNKDKIIQAMKDANTPLSAGEVEKLTSLDRKEVA